LSNWMDPRSAAPRRKAAICAASGRAKLDHRPLSDSLCGIIRVGHLLHPGHVTSVE
jgi:hypothetical protein